MLILLKALNANVNALCAWSTLQSTSSTSRAISAVPGLLVLRCKCNAIYLIHEISNDLGCPFPCGLNGFQRPFRLSVSRFVQKIFAIKSRSRRKTEQMYTFGPRILWERPSAPTFLRRFVIAIYCPRQSLVVLRLLISVCETWQ